MIPMVLQRRSLSWRKWIKKSKKGVVLDEEITEGVENLKKDSPAAAYKAEKILETQNTVFNNKGSKLPSDSDR